MNASKIGPPLARTQLGALAALLLCAQMALWAHINLWVAFAGTALVFARLVFPFDRNNLRPGNGPAGIDAWTRTLAFLRKYVR